MRSLVAGAAVASLYGCAVGPDYREPELPLGGQFAAVSSASFTQEDPPAEFWRLFGDPMLDRLVQEALAENKDLDRARGNLRAARAARRLTGFDAYPTIDASAAHLNILRSEQQLPNVPRDLREGDDIDAGFDASWELDFFGRVRRGIEASRAEEQGAAASLRDAQVIVTAEVARNYFVLRGLQNQLAVATQNAENQRRTLGLTQVRLDAGRGTELDTSRAESQLRTTLASIPPLQASIATTTYRLSVLTGRMPAALSSELLAPQPMPALPRLTAIGTPDALLRRRPDIRVAERALAASTARIGVAAGNLFPRVTFIGSAGYNGGSVSELGDPGTDRFTFGPRISWAALDLGRVRARIGVAEAQTQSALAAYESAVLTALEETEGTLISYGYAQSRRDTLEQAATASSRAAELAKQRFEGGLSDFLDVLDAERDALSVQDSLAQSRTQTATSLVAVYKALGGGWGGPASQ